MLTSLPVKLLLKALGLPSVPALLSRCGFQHLCYEAGGNVTLTFWTVGSYGAAQAVILSPSSKFSRTRPFLADRDAIGVFRTSVKVVCVVCAVSM